MNDSIFNAPAFAHLIAVEVAHLLEQSIGDDVLTTHQAAAFLHIHENTVLVLVKSRELPGRKVGRDWRFRRSELLRYISEGRRND